jgi:hypothetical protein
MMDPGMGAAPMPPEAAMPAPQSPVEMVIAALGAMQMQRKGENDAVLTAVLKATGAGMPGGEEGVAEGGAFGMPGDDMAGGAY